MGGRFIGTVEFSYFGPPSMMVPKTMTQKNGVMNNQSAHSTSQVIQKRKGIFVR
jgi:hypothetical protein